MLKASIIFIRNEDGILLLKRSPASTWKPNCWCAPGGKAEPGETPEETIRREAVEETGITLRGINHCKTITDAECSRIIDVFSAYTSSTEVHISHEHSDYLWCTKSNRPSLLETTGPIVNGYLDLLFKH